MSKLPINFEKNIYISLPVKNLKNNTSKRFLTLQKSVINYRTIIIIIIIITFIINAYYDFEINAWDSLIIFQIKAHARNAISKKMWQ